MLGCETCSKGQWYTDSLPRGHMLSHSFSTNQSGTTNGFLSRVPSGRPRLGTEFVVPEGGVGLCQMSSSCDS